MKLCRCIDQLKTGVSANYINCIYARSGALIVNSHIMTLTTFPSSKSLVVKVEIQTTDMAEVRSEPALIDSGATGLFMSKGSVKCHRLNTRKLEYSIAVYNINGLPNEAGSITKVVDAILHVNGHSERANFAVTNLGKQNLIQNLILGFTWLQKHNPEINWQTQKITMSQCQDKCHTCRVEIHNEQKNHPERGATNLSM